MLLDDQSSLFNGGEGEESGDGGQNVVVYTCGSSSIRFSRDVISSLRNAVGHVIEFFRMPAVDEHLGVGPWEATKYGNSGN